MGSLETLRRRERLIAAVRWVAAGVALLHAALLPAVSGARTAALLVVVGLLVTAGAAEVALRTTRTAPALARLGIAVLLADVACGVAFATVHGGDPALAAWAALTLLPFEAGMRAGIAGALVAAVAIAALHLGIEAAVREPVAAGVAAFRIGLLLTIGLSAGLLARDLERQRRVFEAAAKDSLQLAGRLRRLELLRTRFVATVAHDLRSPLTLFKGVAEVLRNRRDQVAPEDLDRMLDRVERQANRLNRLADDLLDAARVDQQKLALHLAPCDLGLLVRAAVADLEDAEVHLDLDPDLVVTADGDRLERAIWNLLSNAEKYGRPPFHVSARHNGTQVELVVRDHGPGLTQRQREHLFEDFGTDQGAPSVGLGLAIVAELVAAHGGEVRYVQADPGAAFVVRLPIAGPST